MKKIAIAAAFAASAIIVCAADAVSLPRPPRPEPPLPQPVFRPAQERAGEHPVKVECTREIVEDNGLLRKVSASIVFTNPNQRVFEGELELPLPDRAAVCGYALEVNGTMVPGVVVGKDEARIAFENEKRQGVDPGIVEHVKGNVWRTRIYPLMPGAPRKAQIDYIVENDVAAADATAEALLESVGLDGSALDRYPHEFSGGQRQRICIARAIAAKPDLLVCDEAVSALDLSVRAQTLELLSALRRRLGLSMLFITHDLGVVRHVADRVVVLNRGRIVEEGDCSSVLAHPRDAYTRRLVDSVPRIFPREDFANA